MRKFTINPEQPQQVPTCCREIAPRQVATCFDAQKENLIVQLKE